MSTRSNLRPQSVITNGNMSADITSSPTILQSLTVGCYTYSWAGTAPVGAVSVEISNDYALNADGTLKTAGTWIPIYFSLNGSAAVNSAPVSGNAGSGVIEWTTGAYAIRTKYTFTSGIGTLQVVVNGKVT